MTVVEELALLIAVDSASLLIAPTLVAIIAITKSCEETLPAIISSLYDDCLLFINVLLLFDD